MVQGKYEKKLTCGCQFIIKYFDPSLPKSNSYSILFILLVKYLKMVQANCPIIFYVIYISPHDLNISKIKYKMHLIWYLSNYVRLQLRILIKYSHSHSSYTEEIICLILGHNMYFDFRSIKIFYFPLHVEWYMLQSDKMETKYVAGQCHVFCYTSYHRWDRASKVIKASLIFFLK